MTGTILGITAIALAIVAIFLFIPLNMIAGSGGLVCAALAILCGERKLSYVAWAISVINMIFLSPATLALLVLSHQAGAVSTILTLMFFALPAVALFLAKRKDTGFQLEKH